MLVFQVRSGQLDDLDTPPLRMLGQDDSIEREEKRQVK